MVEGVVKLNLFYQALSAIGVTSLEHGVQYKAKVEASVGVGVSAGVKPGWYRDTGGYCMLGLCVGASLGLKIKATICTTIGSITYG